MIPKPQPPNPFGLVPVKREGAIANPHDFTWECNLDECETCRNKFLKWEKAYLEQEKRG